jgi:D-aminopeptidase
MRHLARVLPLLAAMAPASAIAQVSATAVVTVHAAERPRARDLGIAPGVLEPGPWNAITDVAGVRVGHVTLVLGDSVRTGVTAVVPHGGNPFQDKVPAGFVAANAFGKFAGSTQVVELGEIETPILLTNTLSVPEAMAGAIEWTLRQPGNEEARSVNAVVGETNDGGLNAIRLRAVRPGHAVQAIEIATGGPVAEGSVGAGTGTQAFGWKGGIGTSSRRLPQGLGGWTVGVLVQSNYGGILQMDGVPVGEDLGRYYLQGVVDRGDADGSVIFIVATDAPLSDRNLERLARRALFAVGRTGSPATNGSGDYAVAFSVSGDVRRTPGRRGEASSVRELPNDRMSPLFQAAVEAAEEAVYNSLLRATTVTGNGVTARAIPVDSVRAALTRYGRH